MANETYCIVKEKKEYTEQVRRWNNETEASGSEMGADIEKLLNNDAFLKELVERLQGNALVDGDKGVKGGVATLGEDGKLEQHVDHSNVDNVPDPDWGDITGKPGSYPPSSHSHSKSEVGLGNVDNTTDANKSVKYAASAGDADTLDGKHASAFANASHSHSEYAASGHTHNYAGSSSSGGTANSALKLSTARTIQTNLASESAASFDGSGNVTPGVTGILPVGNGGTGNSSGYVRAGQRAGTTIGDKATAEGDSTQAKGTYSHAEGYRTSAYGDYSHAEGKSGSADGTYSHAEGDNCIATGDAAHSEGGQTRAAAFAAHAEGCMTTAEGDYSHAEGSDTYATGANSHAEGWNSKATGIGSHAEGTTTTASGEYSHAEGKTTASGNYSHAEGSTNAATGYCSHAEGEFTNASGSTSHAGGSGTVAATFAQTAIGSYNVQYGTDAHSINSYFIVGNGSASTRSNAFRVHSDGTPYGKKAYNTSGADYAEYFEWLDGNPDNEDRRGYFVTMDGEKIKLASSQDDYILGVISGKPSVIGNSDPDGWHAAFAVDDFGEFIMEKTMEKRVTHHTEEVEEMYTAENGNEAARMVTRVVPEETWVEVDSYVMSPDYDDSQPYIPRSERQEWAAVGMLGVLRVRDDGTCQANGYCTVADGGIATASDHGYRVIGRVTDSLVKIVFR